MGRETYEVQSSCGQYQLRDSRCYELTGGGRFVWRAFKADIALAQIITKGYMMKIFKFSALLMHGIYFSLLAAFALLALQRFG